MRLPIDPPMKNPAHEEPRPSGQGLGECPNKFYTYYGTTHCGCKDPCIICGCAKHTGIHMHCLDEKPGDPPFGHEFKSATAPAQGGST